jgi:transposase-like protein
MARTEGRNMSEGEKASIRAEYAGGGSISEIAEKFKRSRTTIAYTVRGITASDAKKSIAAPPKPEQPVAQPRHVNGETLSQIVEGMVREGVPRRTFTIPVTVTIGT